MKTKFALFTVLMIFAVVALSSCNKNVEPMAVSEDSYTTVFTPEPPSLRSFDPDGWARVSDNIKSDYYQAYKYACNADNPTVKIVEKAPLAIGFYAAFNAANGTDYKNEGNAELKTLCLKYYWGAYFGKDNNYGYSTSEERFFKQDIINFVSKQNLPVAVYAKTDKWGRKGIRDNILTVWAVSEDKVKVTKISDIPNSEFWRNNIITLTWSDLFKKATDISPNKVANVAYMSNSIE